MSLKNDAGEYMYASIVDEITSSSMINLVYEDDTRKVLAKLCQFKKIKTAHGSGAFLGALYGDSYSEGERPNVTAKRLIRETLDKYLESGVLVLPAALNGKYNNPRYSKFNASVSELPFSERREARAKHKARLSLEKVEQKARCAARIERKKATPKEAKKLNAARIDQSAEKKAPPPASCYRKTQHQETPPVPLSGPIITVKKKRVFVRP